MLIWSIEQKELNLIYSWKISRSESSSKTNFFIHVSDGDFSAIGEVAPNIRYGENPEKVREQFAQFLSYSNQINTLEDLIKVIDNLNIINSLSFGIESAYVHLQAKKNNIPVYQQLGLPKPNSLDTTYTLPIMEVSKVKDFINRYNLLRFSSLKIKINQDNGYDLIEEVRKISNIPLKIDANEAWQDVEAFLKFSYQLKGQNIDFFEQPLPSNLVEEYIYLKKLSPFELIADESVTNSTDFEMIAKQFHGVNMKLMKAGGYLKGISIIQESRKQGLKTMIGCMVETTLGIFSAINLCNDLNYIDLDGFFLIENEPFKLVTEEKGRLNIVT